MNKKIPFIDWSRAPLGTTHAYIGEDSLWAGTGIPVTSEKQRKGWTQMFPDREWYWHDRFGWCSYARLAGEYTNMDQYVEKPISGQCANVDIKLLHDTAVLPKPGTSFAAGYDISYSFEGGYDLDLDMDQVTIEPGEVVKLGTGLAFSIPDNIAMLVLPRSGMATKQKLRPANTPGLIDPDYRGELIIALENFGDEAQTIRDGDRIAQVIFTPFIRPLFKQVDELDSTVRGSGGFGSTGIYV